MTTSPEAKRGLRLHRLDLAEADRRPEIAAERDRLIRRGAVPDQGIREEVRAILRDVRETGGAAVRIGNARYGGGLADGRLTVDGSELVAARDRLAPDVLEALDITIANVRRFAEAHKPATSRTVITPGVEIERRWTPVGRVGAYVPGGSAAYPSSLVMCVVPARVAGVGSIVVASPADREGQLHPVLLGTAGLLGIDQLVVAGGAQAIGALAYGLPESGVAPVDKIVGPGSPWVTAAKLEVFGEVGVDLPAGPSEVMVLADATAEAAHVAADLLSQAEHGPDSPAILVTPDADFADAVELEIVRRLALAPRRDILERSLLASGVIVLAPDRDSAIAFADAYAAEHLTVVLADAEEAVARIANAGSLFVGPYAPESAGDYASGANHVLPTGGLARSSGGLGVEDFGKYVQVQRIDRDGLRSISRTVTTLAAAEGLPAHAAAVEARFEGEG